MIFSVHVKNLLGDTIHKVACIKYLVAPIKILSKFSVVIITPDQGIHLVLVILIVLLSVVPALVACHRVTVIAGTTMRNACERSDS